MLSPRVAGTGLLISAIAVASSACEDKPTSTAPAASASATADGGPNAPSVDPRIAKALESAAAKAGDAGATEDGPPPNGVFGPGEADKAHPKDAPRKVQLFGDGSEPRVKLAGTADALPSRAKIVVAQRIGPQAMPTLEYTLGIKAAKAAVDGEEPAAGAAKSPTITLTVKDVGLAKTQPGAVPRDLDKEVAKLKGSTIRAQLAPDGAWSGANLEPSEKADEGLRPALEALVGAVDLAWVPAPSKPVGSGAYWMVVDRARPAGVEVVRYRVYRVTALDGKGATLSMDVRQYSVGGLISFPGAPEGLVLTALGMNSTGKATVQATAGVGLAQQLELAMPLQLQMEAKERPGQAMLLQAEMAVAVQTPGATPRDGAGEPTAKPAAAAAPTAAP